MAYDGKVLDVVATTDRARFAADLAKHANKPYGVRGKTHGCALSRFFGGSHGNNPFNPIGLTHVHSSGTWQATFISYYDRLRHNPTGFDCLAILNSIPA